MVGLCVTLSVSRGFPDRDYGLEKFRKGDSLRVNGVGNNVSSDRFGYPTAIV